MLVSSSVYLKAQDTKSYWADWKQSSWEHHGPTEPHQQPIEPHGPTEEPRGPWITLGNLCQALQSSDTDTNVTDVNSVLNSLGLMMNRSRGSKCTIEEPRLLSAASPKACSGWRNWESADQERTSRSECWTTWTKKEPSEGMFNSQLRQFKLPEQEETSGTLYPL